MRAKELVDSSYVTVDLREDHSIEGVVLPRFSTWRVNSKGIPTELIALSSMLASSSANLSSDRVSAVKLSEALSSSDKEQIARIVKKEIKASEKKDKKDDTELVRNALISFVRTLYTKRSFWASDIQGGRSS